MRPFYARLRRYFSDVGQVLQGQASAASIFPNSTDVGMSRERVYAEVLEQHLPANCSVNCGGFLFDLNGNESRQIDLIINHNSSLQFNHFNAANSGKSFSCIDGCLGVVSIKSRLSKEQLTEALQNIASIPDKQPLMDRINPLFKLSQTDYDDFPFKIIYASDGVSQQHCYETVLDFYRKSPNIPVHKRPNLIHVAGKHYLFRSPNDHPLTTASAIPAGEYMGRVEEVDVFSLLFAILNIQKAASAANNISFNYDSLLAVSGKAN